MAETTLNVNAGVCRFKTVVIADMDEEMNITFKIKSECPAVREMAKTMTEPIPVFSIIEKPFVSNIIYEHAEALAHVACPVPSAIIKAAEVAGDLALKKPVTFEFE